MQKQRKKHYSIIYYHLFTKEIVAKYDCDALPAKLKIKAVRLFCPQCCYGKIKSEMI